MTEVQVLQQDVQRISTPTEKRMMNQGSMGIAVYELLRNADVLMKSGEPALALNLLRVASSQDSKNPVVLSRLAQGLETCHKFDEALVAWKALCKIQSKFEFVFSLAQCLYKLERDEEALQAYYECMSLVDFDRAELFDVYKNVGNILVKQGDFDAAEEYFNKAFSMNRDSDVLLVNIATLEFQRNDQEKALFGFRQALEINSLNDKAWVGLALLHQQMGDVELSLANLEKAIDINSKNRTALLLYGSWAKSMSEKMKASEYIGEYLTHFPEDVDLSLLGIQIFCQVKKTDLAEIELERAFMFSPLHAELSRLYQETHV